MLPTEGCVCFFCIFFMIFVLCRAQLFLAGDEPELAYQDILEVLTDNPRDFSALCVKAKCLFMKGEFEKSLVLWHHVNRVRENVTEVG